MTRRLSVASVLQAVASATDISVSDIVGAHRSVPISRARHLTMWLAHKWCPHLSYPLLGRLLGGRDHSTVIHGVSKIRDELAAGGPPAADLAAADATLQAAFDALGRLGLDDVADPDPLEIAGRAVAMHGASSLTYPEIQTLASFVVQIVATERLIADEREAAAAVTAGVDLAIRRAIAASRQFGDARYSRTEASATDALMTAIAALEEAYIAAGGAPMPRANPAFKNTSNRL